MRLDPKRLWVSAIPRLSAGEMRWLLVGVFVRLCFMPIAFHADLLFMIQVSNYIAFHGALAPNTYYLQNFGMLPTDTQLHYYIFAAWLWLISPITPKLDSLIANKPYVFTPLINDPSLFRTLFLVKLPFLAFDIATALLLRKTASQRSSWVFKFWMVNPIAIYVSYIWGGYDIVPVFFTVLALYYAQGKKTLASYLALGVAGALKLYAFLFLPVMIIAFPTRFRNQLGRVLLSLVPYLVSIVPDCVSSWPNFLPLNTLSARQSQYLIGLQLNVGTNTIGLVDVLYVFVLLYTLLLLFQYNRRPNRPLDLWKYMFGVLMLYFATSTFHPQYFLWVVPFIDLAISRFPRLLKPHLIQILCYVLYTFNLGSTSGAALFAPLSPFLTVLSSPYDLISTYAPASVVIGAARSVFSGVGLWMIYMAFKGDPLDR